MFVLREIQPNATGQRKSHNFRRRNTQSKGQMTYGILMDQKNGNRMVFQFMEQIDGFLCKAPCFMVAEKCKFFWKAKTLTKLQKY